MKERPILFSAPMVHAILEGRKTQTRRKVFNRRTTDYQSIEERDDGTHWPWRETEDAQDHWYPCPYGQPGDRLWVRETWQGPLIDEELEEEFHQSPDYFKKPSFCAYRASDTLDAINADGEELGWRPSIHMPRWASRILLEVTGVRVERLQDISESDAMAEGVERVVGPTNGVVYRTGADNRLNSLASGAYAMLWEQINGAGSWFENPWVWVVEFKRVTP